MRVGSRRRAAVAEASKNATEVPRRDKVACGDHRMSPSIAVNRRRQIRLTGRIDRAPRRRGRRNEG
jgi:hypothetical protein